jgi:hypothetical protein
MSAVVRTIDLQQMAPLRNVTQRISRFLNDTLCGYLEPLTHLLAPHRVLGPYMEGHTRERVAGAEKNFSLLEQRYLKLCRETFNLPAKLSTPLPTIKKKLKIYPWEYHYQCADETITITSPVRWVLSYEAANDLSTLLEARRTGEKSDPEITKQLMINYLTMWITMGQQKGVKQILKDLRFNVTEATSPVAGDLPFIVINSEVPSFRPQDDLIQMVVQLSGKPVLEELMDLDAIQAIEDPLLTRLQDLARE